MAVYFDIPLKKTFEVDWIKPLKKFIKDTYPNLNVEDYESAVQDFNRLRNMMISKFGDRHESSLEVMYRYCDQLVAVESKFPIAENQIRVDFKWQDCFDKEGLFSRRRTMKLASAKFEKVCVWFNIAALASQIAKGQSYTTDDGLKSAAKFFMQSSGIYGALKDCVLSHVQGDPTPDLNPDTLAALAALTLAQAQDCFCKKAILDKMTPLVISKLAMQCSDFYADLMKILQLPSLKSLWPKDWIPSAVSKQAAFHGLSEYYQSKVHKEAKEFGEEIVRLQHAKKLMGEAEKQGGTVFMFGDQSKNICTSLADAQKDNDYIYHVRLPEFSSMPALGKHQVAKPTPIPEKFSSNFTDVFSKLVPFAVHEAIVAFENRKDDIVNIEIGRLAEATHSMNGVLSSLNLPAALEDLSGSAVPQSLLEKGSKLRQLGGMDYLNKLMRELPDLLKRNQEILNEITKALNEEASSDTQLKDRFKESWTRTPSSHLTPSMKEEAANYNAKLKKARDADKVVHERFIGHREGMAVLSKSDQEIEHFVPSGNPVVALKDTPVVKELKALMEQVKTIKTEREDLEKEIKMAKCDTSSKFKEALAADGGKDEHSMSQKELDEIFNPLRKRVTDSVERQESVMANVKRANDKFTAAKTQKQADLSREEKLRDLAAAYDMFVELKGNLEEGTKFYSNLTQLLVKFQSKVNDFCFARKTEKDELMKDLQSDVEPPSYTEAVAMTPGEYTHVTTEGLKVRIYQADITKVRAQAIVTTTKDWLHHAEAMALKKNRPMKVTEVTSIPADGRLYNDHVIYTVGPIWGLYPDKNKCASVLKQTFLNVLNHADSRLSVKSLATPAISSGLLCGVPLDVCTQALFSAIQEFSPTVKNLEQVHLVDQEEEAAGMMSIIFKQLVEGRS